jgi:hypothetical protein
MRRVAILYGTAEGPALTWRLRPALRVQGYDITRDISEADCVITHSGGVLELPPALPGKTVVITVPSTGYEGSLAHAAVRKVILDVTHAWREHAMGFWLRKTLINIWYGANIARLYALYKQNKRLGHSLPQCTAAEVAVMVQPHDPWSRDLPPESVHAHPGYTYITIPGHHDDIWARPQLYVALLKRFDALTNAAE